MTSPAPDWRAHLATLAHPAARATFLEAEMLLHPPVARRPILDAWIDALQDGIAGMCRAEGIKAPGEELTLDDYPDPWAAGY